MDSNWLNLLRLFFQCLCVQKERCNYLHLRDMLVHFFCTVVFANNNLAIITTDYETFRDTAYTGTIREAIMAKIALMQH